MTLKLKMRLKTFLLGFSLLITGCSQPHSPEESIQLFYESLNSQDYPVLISLFSLEDNLKERESEAELYELLSIIFKDLALNIQDKRGIQKIEYHSIEYNNEKDHAIVRYTLFFNDDSSVTDTLALTKDHTGYWQLTLE